MITLLAGALSAVLFTPAAAFACDGACSGGNNTTWAGHHHHLANQGQQPGTGEGLNNGVNLSLDQSQQNHNQIHNKNWSADHKRHNSNTNG